MVHPQPSFGPETDGGRLAVTAWEPVGPVDERLPERTRRMNLARVSPMLGSSKSGSQANPTGMPTSAGAGQG
jgi:hypothetical protein